CQRSSSSRSGSAAPSSAPWNGTGGSDSTRAERRTRGQTTTSPGPTAPRSGVSPATKRRRCPIGRGPSTP
ncbi:MAG: hypothetical protein AVDCRST_MAG08-4139, partial [uncultured Acetobacteraceae bacterium]